MTQDIGTVEVLEDDPKVIAEFKKALLRYLMHPNGLKYMALQTAMIDYQNAWYDHEQAETLRRYKERWGETLA